MDETQRKNDWNWRLVRYFLYHKQLAVLCFLLVVSAGIFSFFQLRVEGFPEVKVPIAVVTTVIPGAGPDIVASSVTTPLEAALRDLANLNQISSTSRANVSVIVLQFSENANLSTAVQDVRTKTSSVTLPEGARQPDIVVPETAGAPYIMAVAGDMPLQKLEAGSKALSDKLIAVKGVKSFTKISSAKQKIYIDLAPQFQSPEIVMQISNASAAFPLGQAVINGQDTAVAGSSAVQTVEDIKKIPISQRGTDGRQSVFRLGDIAGVYEGTDFAGSIHRLGYNDGNFITQPAILYEVRLTSDADLLKLDDSVRQAVSDAQNEAGADIHYVIALNQAESSRQQIKEIVEGAVGGKWNIQGFAGNIGYIFGAVWLLVIVMLLFMDAWSALISVIAIPLSFLITFIFLAFFGIQLNTIVLFSIILVLGLIVDPAIVVLESIKRYVEAGYRGEDAVLRSTETIGRGIFMSVFTSLIVFVPFGIVSGTFGEIIKYIPLTVIPALVASYVVPMIFLTWLAARLLKPRRSVESLNEDDPRLLWGISRWFIRANRFILRRIWLQIAIIILGLLIPVSIAGYLFSSGKVQQVQFAKPDDTEFISVSVPIAPGTTNEQLITDSQKLESILANYQKYINTYFYLDFSGSGAGGQSISATVLLKKVFERDSKSPDIARRMEGDLRSAFGEQALAREVGTGPPEESYPVAIRIYDNDTQKLLSASEKVASQMRTYPEVSAVQYDLENTSSELVVMPDSAKLASMGLNSQALFGQLSGILGERTIFTSHGTDVVLRTPASMKPTTVEQLKNTFVAVPGGLVTLASVASVSDEKVGSSIKRINGERYESVRGRVSDTKDTIRIQRDIDSWARDNASSMGLSDRAFSDRAGENEFEKSFRELFTAIALSIIFTYVVFVLFFGSFIQPFIILFAVPLLFIGAFPALVAVTGGQFGFLETLGIIMVIGIVENVGIFMIDYANRKKETGMDKKEAIALASGIRFRPIILTKLTALAGLLPLAIFAPFWRGLAVVVIAGIVSSGILSLFTTPVLYSWFTRNKKLPPEILKPEVNTPPVA